MKFKSNSHYQKTQCCSHVLFGKVLPTFLILCESFPNDIWAFRLTATGSISQEPGQNIVKQREIWKYWSYDKKCPPPTCACVYAVPSINCQSTMYCINYTLLILTVAGFYNAIENCTILFQLFILKEKSESIQIDTELCTQATINNRFDWFLSLPNTLITLEAQ